MSKLYLAMSPADLGVARNAGEDAILYSDSAGATADRFVLFGKGAEHQMTEMIASGLPREMFSWAEHYGAPEQHLFSGIIGLASQAKPFMPGQYQRCGISGLEKVVRWRESEVIVVAGPYFSGKSTFAQILAQDFARMNSQPVMFCCWEDQASKIRHGLETYRDTVGREEGAEFNKHWLDMFHIVKVDKVVDRFLDDYLDLVRFMAKREGVKMFVLDPWNEFDHQKHAKQSETEYVREVMKAIRRLADELKVKIQIVTHVSAEFIGHDGSVKPFKIAHAFGSSQFANKADRGFCVLRTDKWAKHDGSHMLVRQDKVKEEDQENLQAMGKRATMLFQYSAKTHCLLYDKIPSESEEVQKIWRG